MLESQFENIRPFFDKEAAEAATNLAKLIDWAGLLAPLVGSENAAELAKRLENHPLIEKVNHPSLQSHPQYEVAQKVMPKGTGMIAFTVKGGDAAALKFMRGLEVIFEATSLGGVESLIECPFNSSHMFIPEDVRIAAGLGHGFVRISVGIEDIEDLWGDISNALASI